MLRHFSCVKAPFSTPIRSWSPSSPSRNTYFSQKPHIQAHQKARTLLLPVPMLRRFPYSFNIAYSSPEFTVLYSQICWSTLLHYEKYLCFRMGKDSMFSAHSRLEGLLLWVCGKVQWKCVSEQTAHLLVAGKRGKKEERLVPFMAPLQWQEVLGLEFHLSDAQSQPSRFLEDCARTIADLKPACSAESARSAWATQWHSVSKF